MAAPISYYPPDYAVPLHVDCSVEYELPECAKPPAGVRVEPLLMIHPCHFRNLERQRRRPFENNLPRRCCDAEPRRARPHPYAAYAAYAAVAPYAAAERRQPQLIYNV